MVTRLEAVHLAACKHPPYAVLEGVCFSFFEDAEALWMVTWPFDI